MKMTTTTVPKSPCPYCGREMDRATLAGSGTPEPGDASLCIRCGAALLFDEQLRLRKPTSEESAELNADPQVIRGQILIAGMKPSSSDKKEPPDYEKARRH